VVTPEALQKHGVPANPGPAVRIARTVFAFAGQLAHKHKVRNPARAEERVYADKKADVGVYLALAASEVIPRPGVDRKRIHSFRQEHIAGRAGWKARSSLSRNLKRSRSVSVERRFGAPNYYHLRIPEGHNPKYAPSDWRQPKIEELAGNPHFGIPIDPRMEKRGANGYFFIPAWLFHEHSPAPKNARVVMAYLFSCGLLQERNGKRVDVIDSLTQRKIARALSMRENTVRQALRHWERHQVLRVVRQKAEKRPDGSMRQPPCKIIWVADKKFTQEVAAMVFERLLRAHKRMRDASWWPQAVRVIQPLLRSYIGTERRLDTFWTELRRKMIADGIPLEIIHQLLARPPE
jgi:hypothetical protein